MHIPRGFRFAGVAAGLKPQRRDVALIVSDVPAADPETPSRAPLVPPRVVGTTPPTAPDPPMGPVVEDQVQAFSAYRRRDDAIRMVVPRFDSSWKSKIVLPSVIDTDMLRSCFGEAAGSYLKADAWAETAVPYILSLGPDDNGQPRTVPGQ